VLHCQNGNSRASTGINQFALVLLIVACLGIYFRPVFWGLNEALQFPPLKSFDTAAVNPEAKLLLPELIPTDPKTCCRVKIAEAAELIDILKQNQTGIYELIRYYRIGIIDLEQKIIEKYLAAFKISQIL
jgi:hypothetical protein